MSVVVAVGVLAGCSEHESRLGRAPTLSTTIAPAISRAVSPTSTIPSPATGGPLELSGSTDAGATIEVRVDGAAAPSTTATDANGRFRFTAPGVRDGAHTMLVAAHAQDGALVGLELDASLINAGSTNRSSVTCSEVVQLQVRIGDGAGLTVNCPPR